MPDPSNRRIPWPRIFAEGVVIVASILLALAADAWWDERQDRNLELEYAERLKTDLARDTLRMAQGIGQNEAKISVLNSLLEPEAIPALVNDPVDAMLLLRFSTYQGMNELAVGAFTEMQDSGRLVLLQDAGLRDQLVSYHSLHGLVTTALAESYGPFRQLLVSTLPGELWHADPDGIEPTRLEQALRSLANHPQLQAAVNAELAYVRETLRWHRFAYGRAGALLEAFDEAYPTR